MRKLARLLALVVAASLPMQSFAAYECNVNLQYVLVYGNGAVNVLHSGRGDYTVVCNLNESYKGVSPTTCAMWTGLLLGAKKRNAKVTFYYGGEGSCSTLPTYGEAPVPGYIGEIPTS